VDQKDFMPRIMYLITVGWLVAATTQVTAQQQPNGAAAVPRSTVARAMPARIASPKMLPGTRPNVFSFIQGNALTSTNAPLTDATMRLRDGRFGQIVETQRTDRAGLFTFPKVDPGIYIVEIIGLDQVSVLAASEVLTVGPGEAVSAVVKVPYNIQVVTRIVGGSTPTAAALKTQAAASGILATQAPGTETCIPLNP
jgi:hypothetical protein